MLLGAIAIIFYAPKCGPPTPLAWWKKGPIVEITADVDEATIENIKKFNVQGVIYELPASETYFVETPNVHDKLKRLVEKFNAKDIHVVIDLTPNYVTEGDELFQEAKKDPSDKESLEAFVTTNTDVNWKKVGASGTAFKKVGNKFFLNQFDNFYDIRLDNPKAQNKFTQVLEHLTKIGIKGFRLANAKHYIFDNIENEHQIAEAHKSNMDDYSFYHHKHSTYVNGLGDLIEKFSLLVKNLTNDEGFLTVKDDMTGHSPIFKPTNQTSFGFDLPRYGFINKHLKMPNPTTARNLYNEFSNFNETNQGLISTMWIQLPFSKANHEQFESTAFNMYIGLLRGVQIAPLDDLINSKDNKTDAYSKLEEIRKTQVFQHGNFNFFISQNDTAFAYSR